jgi:hypothetical protein
MANGKGSRDAPPSLALCQLLSGDFHVDFTNYLFIFHHSFTFLRPGTTRFRNGVRIAVLEPSVKWRRQDEVPI